MEPVHKLDNYVGVSGDLGSERGRGVHVGLCGDYARRCGYDDDGRRHEGGKSGNVMKKRTLQWPPVGLKDMGNIAYVDAEVGCYPTPCKQSVS